MSKTSSTASALCTRAPIIRDDWTAQQALAVFELLDELRERLWQKYGLDIQTLLRDERSNCPALEERNTDDPPF